MKSRILILLFILVCIPSVKADIYYIRETYTNDADLHNPLVPPYRYMIHIPGAYSCPASTDLNSDHMKESISNLPAGSVLILTGRYMPPKQQLESIIDYCKKINIEFRINVKEKAHKSSNQSLERTPLGLSVCMGSPSMVSLSSSR